MVGRRAATVVLAVAVCAGCVIDEPVIERTDGPTATAVIPTVAFPSVTPVPTSVPTPTAPPPPTVAPTATAAPTATPSPVPTATPPPIPTPLPTTIPAVGVEPTLRRPGVITVPVHGTTTFQLAQARPILQLPGHTLIYVDADRQGEVDLFTPVADRNGAPLSTYDEVIDEILNASNLAGMTEVDSTMIDGFRTRVFDGTGEFGERVFFTGEAFTGNENAGWSPPVRLRLWVIDTTTGPVVLTAESLEDPGQFAEALAIATGVLSTIDLG